MTTLRVVIVLILVPFSVALTVSIGIYSRSPAFAEWIWLVAFLPTGITSNLAFRGKYDNLDVFIESDARTTVNEFESIITIAYIEIFAIIGLIVTYNLLPASWNIGLLKPVSGEYLYLPPVVWPFIASVYITFFSIYGTYFRKDFGFLFALKSIAALKEIILLDKKREVEIVQYLIIALKWYNKFVKKNLKLEFDTAKVCSSILTNDNRKRILLQLVNSFGGYVKKELPVNPDEVDHIDFTTIPVLSKLTKPFGIVRKRFEYIDDTDKLEPINCLSKIVDLPSSETLLIQKKLSTITKEIVGILVGIIPVFIGVFGFILDHLT
jgi:hypothetical protein